MTSILVVEDDPAIRETLCELLDEEGYKTLGAAHGEDALKLLKTHPLPQLILLDMMMPVMDGWAFRTELAKDPTYDDVPIVIISARTDVGTVAQSLRAAAFLRKPLDLDSLLEVLERFVTKP